MPRPLRLEFEGAVYHVIARGNERKAVFRDDQDRETYLRRLAECRRRLGFSVLAYCLMENHVHLALERGSVPLSRIMLNLHSFYGQRFNRRHERVGHLFQGRYKAFLIEKDRYLLALLNYIHANPSKAGLVSCPQEFPWSSARYFWAGRGPEWLDLDRVYGLLGAGRRGAAARHLVSGEAEGAYEDAPPLANSIKGTDQFARRVLAESGAPLPPPPGCTVEGIASLVASAERLSLERLRERGQAAHLSRARSIAALLAQRESGIPVSRMAKYFGRDESTLAKGVRRLESSLVSDERLRARIRALAACLRSKSA